MVGEFVSAAFSSPGGGLGDGGIAPNLFVRLLMVGRLHTG